MKILVTGKNSYIGMSLENWLNQWPDKYQVDTLCLIKEDWKNYDFSQYDVVFHVAGIVHQKEKPGMKNLYFSINSVNILTRLGYHIDLASLILLAIQITMVVATIFVA